MTENRSRKRTRLIKATRSGGGRARRTSRGNVRSTRRPRRRKKTLWRVTANERPKKSARKGRGTPYVLAVDGGCEQIERQTAEKSRRSKTRADTVERERRRNETNVPVDTRQSRVPPASWKRKKKVKRTRDSSVTGSRDSTNAPKTMYVFFFFCARRRRDASNT